MLEQLRVVCLSYTCGYITFLVFHILFSYVQIDDDDNADVTQKNMQTISVTRKAPRDRRPPPRQLITPICGRND